MKKIFLLFLALSSISLQINAQNIEEIKATNSPINTAGLFVFNNKLFFGGMQTVGQSVLWSSDGTAAGTNPLKTGTLGFIFGSDAFGNAAVFNNKIFFGATTSADGKQLWSTDGTDAGLTQFKKFNSTGINMRYFIEYNTKLYFLVDDGVHGLELWSTDGTSAKTQMVADINPSGNGFDYVSNGKPADPSFTIMNNKLFFKANDGVHGLELWVTDGTASGTQMVKDINSSGSIGAFNGASSGRLGLFAVYNNNLYFTANDGVGSGYDLWVSDGTAAGTKKFLSKDATSFLFANNLTVFNNRLYFYGSASIQVSINNYVTQAGLWCTDGTTAGTTIIKDFNSINGDNGLSDATRMGSMRIYNNKMYFAGTATKDSQSHLWASDGTTNGTLLVAKINSNGTSFETGTASSQTFCSNIFSNRLFFIADDGKGFDLFSTDGTATGTYKVNSPSHTFSQQLTNRGELCVYNGSLYFCGNYTGISDLWRVKGSATGIEDSKNNSIAAEFSLEQNYPNPFNPSTTISYKLQAAGKVTLKVFDLLGREVATLVDEVKQPGVYHSNFSASQTFLSSGIYFYTLKSNNYSSTKKMILSK